MSLGENIKKYRELKGINQEKLALMLGKSKNVISNWESNRNKPDASMIQKLSLILDISADTLFELRPKPNGKNKFGETLCYFRKQSKMSQEEVGNYIGVTKATISKYEKGQCIPSVEKANLLAECLRVTLDELIGDEFDESVKDYIRPIRLAYDNNISADQLIELINVVANIKRLPK